MAAKPAPHRRECAGPAGRVNWAACRCRARGDRMPGSDWAGDSIESCSCGHFHGADMELTPKRYMDTVVLSPMGRIDHSTSEDFKAALAPHMTRCAEGQDRVVLDFA